jgi:hypothetical protein
MVSYGSVALYFGFSLSAYLLALLVIRLLDEEWVNIFDFLFLVFSNKNSSKIYVFLRRETKSVFEIYVFVSKL